MRKIMTKDKKTILVGDIGGTNCRLALFHNPANGLSDEAWQLTDDFPGPGAAISAYTAQQGAALDLAGAAIAVAGPVNDEVISLTNAHWRFTRKDVAQAAGTGTAMVVNDLAAVARAAVALPPDNYVAISAAAAQKSPAHVTVVAPGTGLGVAAVFTTDRKPLVIATEGGHVGFSPEDDIEVEILRLIHAACGHVTNELILSGPGIVRLYRALASIHGAHAEPISGKDIAERGVAQTDELCAETIKRFAKILGAVCADTVLIQGTEGLILAGSIVTTLMPVLQEGGFRARFEARGPRNGYLQNHPTIAVPRTDLGLLGAGLLFIDQMPDQ
jgi:glucokinase